jgi:hypothetical protein
MNMYIYTHICTHIAMIRQVCVHVFTHVRNMTCLVFQSIKVLQHPDVAHVPMPSRMPKTSESKFETREGPNLQVVVRARCGRLDPAPPSHTAVAPTPSHAKSAPKKKSAQLLLTEHPCLHSRHGVSTSGCLNHQTYPPYFVYTTGRLYQAGFVTSVNCVRQSLSK